MPRAGEVHNSEPHYLDPDGTQHIYQFPNGRGASVVRCAYSYGGANGLWELAVIRQTAPNDCHIDYTTPITDDVIGWQTWDEIEALLDQIASMPPVEELADATPPAHSRRNASARREE